MQDGVVEVSVPKDMMGAVIGRGGSRISEIRMLSTQEIKIHEVEGESPSRRITVQGSKENIDKAMLLLHVCVNVYTEPKDKVGHMQLVQAVQYAQNKDGENQFKPRNGDAGHVDASRQMNQGYNQGPYHMDYYPPFPQGGGAPRMPYQGGAGRGGGYSAGHHNSKKRPLIEPSMTETVDDGEISVKREKFRQF